nr:PREDICTED: uncharacterized protein LOC105662311 isoform X1 [Megachile rotundata]XP_012139073.1 PREDICTED: uncharacterized protein LOC105662311 isoform X1 [Megachile rotundata]XP_012139074.1 PREDICTED: uncharacterized protein LOC105662311 isoform X1 [Megachile rotundata]
MKFMVILLLYIFSISADQNKFWPEHTQHVTPFAPRHDYQVARLTNMILELSKNISSIAKIKTDIFHINARTSRIEQLISQRNENAKRDVEKITSNLEGTKNQLNGKLIYLENKLYRINHTFFAKLSQIENTLSFNSLYLNTTEPLFTRQRLIHDTVKPEIAQLKDMAVNQASIIKALTDRVNRVGTQIQGLQISLDNVKYLVEDTGRHLNKPKCNLTCNITPYSAILPPVKSMMENISDQIQQLPRIRDVEAIKNETVTRLKTNENVVKNVLWKGINDLENKIPPNWDKPSELRLCDRNNASNINQDDFQQLYTQLRLINTDIIENKRKVDDGVQRILSEIGFSVKGEAANINTNLIRRFNGISNDIAKEEQTIVTHITNKMEQKLNQVLQEIYVIREYMTFVKNANVPKH